MSKIEILKNSGTYKKGDILTINTSIASCLKVKGICKIIENKKSTKLVTK